MTTSSMPDGLVWHYTDAAGLLSILRSHTLWATSSSFLNDRQEVRLGAELARDRVHARLAGEPLPESGDLEDRLAEAAAEGELPSSSHFFILSASRSGDSLAMWRLYGGVRESYAIGLDPTAALGVLTDGDVAAETLPHTTMARTNGMILRRMEWSPVTYEPDEQHAMVDHMLDGALHQTRRRPDSPDAATEESLREWIPELDALMDDVTETLLLIKHEGFVDEREVRLAVVAWARPEGDDPDGAGAGVLRYRASAYGITPYVALTGTTGPEQLLVTEPGPLPIRAVAVSPSPNGPESQASVRRLLAVSGYGDVPVVGSMIPFRAE